MSITFIAIHQRKLQWSNNPVEKVVDSKHPPTPQLKLTPKINDPLKPLFRSLNLQTVIHTRRLNEKFKTPFPHIFPFQCEELCKCLIFRKKQ